MSNTKVVRNLSPADLDQVTNVHFAAFPDGALTKLGREAVRRYYEWQIVGPHDAVNTGAFDGDTMLGFCFGGIFRGALGGFLEKNRSFLIRQVITHPWLMLNPLFRERAAFALKRLTQRFTKPKKSSPPPVPKPAETLERAFGILSIAVHPQYQGSGAAKLLMEHAEQKAVERGFKRMGLTVHPSNARAVRFYEKMGWQRNLTNGVWEGSMTKWITSTPETKPIPST